MAIKINYFQKEKTSPYDGIICYKIIRKSIRFKHILGENEVEHSLTDRFQTVYETRLTSFDITDYIGTNKEWQIPEEIKDEIISNKILGFIPKNKIIKEGFIFTYTRQGVINYVNELQHSKTIYGKSHFNEDLRIYQCIIPRDTLYYTGDNNGKSAYASKSLIFMQDITDEIL